MAGYTFSEDDLQGSGPQGGDVFGEQDLTPKQKPILTAPPLPAYAPPQYKPSMNYPNRFLAGAAGGVYGAGLGALQTVIETMNKLGVYPPEAVNLLRQEELQRRQTMDTMKQEHQGAPWWSPNPASVGEFAGEVAPYATIPVAGAEKAAASLIGRVAPKIATGAGRVVAGAGLGGATAGLAPRAGDESRAGNAATGAALGGVMAGLLEGGKSAWNYVANKGELQKVIDYGLIRSGVAPTSAKNPAQVAAFKESGRSAVMDMAAVASKEPMFDKGNRALPNNYEEALHLFQKTKGAIYDGYHDMLLKAAKSEPGKTAAIVDTAPIRESLELFAGGESPAYVALMDKVASGKATKKETDLAGMYKAFQTHGDQSARFLAQDLLGKYNAQKALTLPEAEKFLEMLNSKLSPFYRSPTRKDAASAMVEASIAADLRKSLDDAVTSLEGPGYKELRKRYGALKGVEEQFTKAAVRASKAPGAWEEMFTDKYSNVKFAYGVLLGHPAMAVAAGATKGLSMWQKWKFDPNNIVRNMFRTVDDVMHNAKSVPSAPSMAGPIVKRAAAVVPAALAAQGGLNPPTAPPAQQKNFSSMSDDELLSFQPVGP